MRNFYLLFFALFAFANLSAQNANTEKISIKLMEKMEANPNAWHSVHVMLADRVDLLALDAELTARKAKKHERAYTVITALQAKANETQGAMLNHLQNSPGVDAGTVKGYWIANAICGFMSKSAIEELSLRDDVQQIGLNGKLELEEYERVEMAPPVSPNGIESGLAAIDAPAMWAMGYTGYGQRAMTSDTGVDPTHPSLESRNYNFYVPQEETWFEFGFGGDHEPFDCSDHGTHVTGTMLGLDRLNNDTIGVAFNANWMGAAILCGIGTEDNIAAFQWALDPDENPSTVDDMPTVVNNSWRDPSMSGIECNSIYVSIFEATEAAGIAVVFSAGNEGPGAMTITPPKNIIINEVNPFAVGALNGNNSNFPIANFSSIGPSVCFSSDSSLLIKPDVSAPGQSVRSCVPGGGYSNFSGTSMAAPHTSGAIMLLAEAFPDLSAFDLKKALYHSCVDLGAVGEDNTFGMGIINVKNAFDSLVAQGNVPVSPYRANDILMVDMQVSDFACGSGVAPAILAENAGTDTIYSFEIYTDIGPVGSTYSWTGVLAPRERVSVQIDPLTPPTGLYDVFVRLGMPNGVEDERPLNNNFRRRATIIDREGFVANIEGGQTVCEGTSALLRGVSPYEEGSLSVNWFDEPLGAEPVSTDEAFITPPLTTSTTYYAEAVYTVPVGERDLDFGESFLLDTTELGMRFEVVIASKLKAVHLFVTETGGRVIALQTPSGEVLHNKVEFVSETGKVKVNLNWDVEPGEYELLILGGKALISNSEGADYPYSIDGIATITGTSDIQGLLNGAWYYFYDWEFEFVEPCGRTPITVNVGSAGDGPMADFTVSNDVVNVADNVSIDFTNTTQDGVSYEWNFGDNTTSTEESPSHTYAFAGEYTVSLVATNAEGCTDAALQTITVEAEEVLLSTGPVLPEGENVAVFPNPISDLLTVHLDLTTANDVELRLSDASGRLVRTAQFDNVQATSLNMQTGDLPEGVYFLIVDMEVGASVWKVVKI